jgi:hypothetical protein
VDSASETTRQARFESELARARTRWQERPELGNCADILKERADTELCHAAASALTAIEQLAPDASPGVVLATLSDAALSLVRLVERARYLSLEDIGKARLEGDAGTLAKPLTSARPSPPAASTPSAGPQKLPRAMKGLMRERAAFKITESPSSHLVEVSARLEREVLRNLGAYLEYGPLPVRQTAFDTTKALQAAHPHWPGLSHLVREASVLETDEAQKQKLNALSELALPRGKKPD